ncbi:beta-1,3-glucan-binding protein-like isoform X2 [Photinus pyralis]|uniref:beta-1,3-glucan-binding protein-like isoform X2 n=1 Tax=Photinus pyralis TaxID=7054 RepID=UPI001267160B|nr:beta-1,3-glucan-binding protein-like isoform X2 [Photinus pyralis]XP_031348779.1 beta-1,3-glucan-binding protein-like isoform X2 [Photinus pyralis]
MYLLITLLCFYGIFSVSGQYYEFSDVLIEPLGPKGLRVSIPDEDGIQLFAFHGKINSPMKGREAGIFSEDIRFAENGRWTFFTNARLKPGDKLYYWIHVLYDGIGYEKDGEPFTVTELIPRDGSTTTSTPPLCELGQTKLNGKTACKGMLIFHETFSRLDKTKWKPEVKFPQVPDFEFVIYDDDPKVLYTEGETLHIRPQLTEDVYGSDSINRELDLNTRCTGLVQSPECIRKPRAWHIVPSVTAAQISTVESFSFIYGAIEVKAKNYGLKKIFSYTHWTDAYHVYRIEWKPDSIVVKVDGVVFGTVYPPAGGFAIDHTIIQVDPAVADRWRKGTVLAPFDQEMYIVLGVGVGGLGFPESMTNKPWESDHPKAPLQFYRNQSTWKQTWGDSSVLEVDYVKVWAL